MPREPRTPEVLSGASCAWPLFQGLLTELRVNVAKILSQATPVPVPVLPGQSHLNHPKVPSRNSAAPLHWQQEVSPSFPLSLKIAFQRSPSTHPAHGTGVPAWLLTRSMMPMLFQPCMMGRKEMKVGITQQPPSISAMRSGVILFLYTRGWQQMAQYLQGKNRKQVLHAEKPILYPLVIIFYSLFIFLQFSQTLCSTPISWEFSCCSVHWLEGVFVCTFKTFSIHRCLYVFVVGSHGTDLLLLKLQTGFLQKMNLC